MLNSITPEKFISQGQDSCPGERPQIKLSEYESCYDFGITKSLLI
jgi:hypothetical protein